MVLVFYSINDKNNIKSSISTGEKVTMRLAHMHIKCGPFLNFKHKYLNLIKFY